MKKIIILVDNNNKQLQILKDILLAPTPNSIDEVICIEYTDDNETKKQIREYVKKINNDVYIHIIIDIFLSDEEEKAGVAEIDGILYERGATGINLAAAIRNDISNYYGNRIVISIMSIYTMINESELEKMVYYPEDLRKEHNIKTEFHYIRKPIALINTKEEEYERSYEAELGCIDWKLFKDRPEMMTRKYDEAFYNIAVRRLELLKD